MRRPTVAPVLVGLLAAAVALAGCSGGGGADAGGGAGGSAHSASLAPGTGGVQGVVVDEAIRPVQGANVTATGNGASRSAETGADGAFLFEGLAPGTYSLVVKHFRYGLVQSAVDVQEGRVASAKLQVQRLFSQEPYHETQKFDGFIQCGWAVGGVASSTCVNDYTHFVGLGYTCPQCEHLVDNRGTTYPLGGGWQTQVYEMVWEQSAQGTSPEMRLTISHFPRPATHWYCSGTGPSPLYVRMELGEVCEDQQDDPKLAPPEGEQNMTMFAAAQPADGQPAALAVSQPFTVFLNFFYYGKPPEGWSFVQGDPYPF
jgi:hypothetical protein